MSTSTAGLVDSTEKAFSCLLLYVDQFLSTPYYFLGIATIYLCMYPLFVCILFSSVLKKNQ